MRKEYKILINFSLWFLCLLFVCFYGIFHVSASEYNFDYNYTQTYYDNYGTYLTPLGQTWNSSLNAYVSNSVLTAPGYTGAGVVISSPIPILANHTYSMTVQFEDIYNLALSTKNNISVGDTISNTASYYTSSTFNANTLQSKVLDGKSIQFAFKSLGSGSYIFIPWTTNVSVTQSYVMTSIIIDDLGNEGVSETTINNSLNNQTNILNNSITSSTNDIQNSIQETEDNIINNQSSNTQSLIDSQASNTQALIDSNKENFNTCRQSVNLFNKNDVINAYLNSSGEPVSNGTFRVSNYILISGDKLTISGNAGASELNAFYDSNYNFISSFGMGNLNSRVVDIPTNAKYLRVTVRNDVLNQYQVELGNIVTSYEPYGEEICTNKLDEAEQTRKGILGKIGDLISGLFDTSDPDTDSLNNMAGWLPPGPVDSILNLPLTFFNTLNNSLGSSCTSFTVSLPFVNKNLTLPCFSDYMSQYISSFNILWTFIGTISSVVILYRYLLALYAWVDDILMLRYNFHEDFGGNSGNFGGV